MENKDEDISVDKLKAIIKEVTGTDEIYWNKIVFEVVKKIINYPNGKKVTMRELLGSSKFTSKQVVDFYKLAVDVCKKINIGLVSTNREREFTIDTILIISKILICPHCGNMLTYLMPSGRILNCNECNKYYRNDNGKVGEEIEGPKNSGNILY